MKPDGAGSAATGAQDHALTRFARRHPVGLYLTLAFSISWLGSLLAWGAASMRGSPAGQAEGEVLTIALAMLAGPSVAGVAMTGLVEGRRGLRELFARMTRWRVGGRWYAALLIFPAGILAVSLMLSALDFPDLAPVFVVVGVPIGLVVGAFEEAGWMGFAFPRMQARFGLLSAALTLGTLHALWHLVADFLANAPAFGGYWLPNFVGFFAFIVALRVLIAWVYAATGSVLLAQLMHASSTGFLIVLVPTTVAPISWVAFYGVYAVVLWIVAALVLARTGSALERAR